MILADENIPALLIDKLRKRNFIVHSIREDYQGISDEEVIDIAKDTNQIILTEDKDFGEWVFAHNIKNISVILLRYKTGDLDDIISLLINEFSKDLNQYKVKFTTITPNKIRIKVI